MSKIKIVAEGKDTRPTPSAFELSVIAALLAKGKEKPEGKLEAAWDLFNEADSLIYRQQEIFSEITSNWEYQEAEWERTQKLNKYVLFLPKENTDPAREYLADKGYRLKTSKALKANLKTVFVRLRNKGWKEEDAIRFFNTLMKKERVHLPESYLDEIIKIRYEKNSKGGEKSHKTRKSNSV